MKEVDEAVITRTIVKEYLEEFLDYTESDVIIVGTGPSGVLASKYLAKEGLKVLMLERQISVGGGMWQGGMLYPKLVVEAPANKLLEQEGIRLKEVEDGVYVASSHEVTSKLVASAIDSGVKIFNSIEVKDLVYRETGVAGVVINWHTASMLPDYVRCVDPLALKSKVVVDATGHAAECAAIARKKLGLRIQEPLEGSMWAKEAEKATLDNTCEIYPNLFVCGMAANSTSGSPRMGPLYGAMFLSGVKVAELIHSKFNNGRSKLKLEKETEFVIS